MCGLTAATVVLSPVTASFAHSLEHDLTDEIHIEIGSEGPEVLALKEALILLGYELDQENDYFDEETEEIVKLLQELNELEITGTVDEEFFLFILNEVEQLIEDASADDENEPVGEASENNSENSLEDANQQEGINEKEATPSEESTEQEQALHDDAAENQEPAQETSEENSPEELLEEATEQTSVQALADDVLQQGDRDPRVIDLKIHLEIMGFKVSNTPNEYFGPVTTTKVKEFQGAYNLEVTGKADAITLSTLSELANGPLQQGMYRADAVDLKINLEKIGYAVSSNPNTYFGPITARQLKAFQSAYGLTADGIVNTETLITLQYAVDNRLSLGMNDPRVIDLKVQLEIVGFRVSNNPNGNYGPITAAKVSEFQAEYGLRVTGIADPLTQDRLNELATVPLEQGMYRADVVDLKINLEKIGYAVSSNPTTYYGPMTASQVRAFQSAYGLTADGIADKETIEKLQDAVANRLYLGINDTRVIDLKKNLEVLGFQVSSNPNGNYGPITESMVKEFQANYGLRVTGIADPLTQNRLDELANGPLQQGMYRADVVDLKLKLAKAGYGVSTNPTIFFGSMTASQVRAFQENYGLPVTGIADQPTLQKLQEVIAASSKTFFIEGKTSFGHGVGMTQNGAYGMAQQGKTYEEILTYYYTGVTVGTDSRYTDGEIRVGLTLETPSVTVSNTSLYSVEDRETGEVLLSNATTSTEISYDEGTFTIKIGNKTVTTENGVKLSGGTFLYKNNRYKGDFHFVPSHSNFEMMDVVNYVDVETYLQGVVPYEMYVSWGEIEAFKAQAIASRTYAWRNINSFRSRTFDVYDSVRSQVYNGIPQGLYNNSIVNQAIVETKDIVIKYGNTLIDAVYSASASGHTVNSEDVWPNSVPYLRGKPDPYDQSSYTRVSWDYTFDLNDLSNMAAFKGNGKGRIIDLEFQTRNDRLYGVTVIFENGMETMTASAFRSAVGTTNLRSTIMTITEVNNQK